MHFWSSRYTRTNVRLGRDWASGMEEEEEGVLAFARDAEGAGGFISADARKRFYLDSTKQ